MHQFRGQGPALIFLPILGAARAGLARATMPVFVLIGGVLILGERFGPLAWLGICIVLSGLLLMSYDAVRKDNKITPETVQADAEKKKAERLLFAKSIVLAMIAIIIMAAGSIFRKAGVSTVPDTILAVTIGSFSALLTCVVTLLVKRKGREMLIAIKNIDPYFLMSGLLASVAIYCMVSSMRRIPVGLTNSISATEPLFTIIFVWLMKEGKKEKLGIQTFFSGVIIVIGTIILMSN